MAAAADDGERDASPPRATCGRPASKSRGPAGFGKPRSPEGFMFPATYFVFETDPAAALVDDQLEDVPGELGEGRPDATRARRT